MQVNRGIENIDQKRPKSYYHRTIWNIRGCIMIIVTRAGETDLRTTLKARLNRAQFSGIELTQ